jgi:guanosine-3',5'-bis(diphosphate) 3'-pyrophosphohydrolase
LSGVKFAIALVMDSVLEKIRDFADKAHGNQQRKYTPERYIVHPVRVMEMCRSYTSELSVLAAALLHDVVEDTPVGEKDIQAFLVTVMNEEEARETTGLVIELTDIYTKAAYPRWNRRKRKTKEAERIGQTSDKAQTIKYADIIDNCKEIVEHDPDFAGVFLRECRSLLNAMPDGNADLRKEAFQTVEQCLQRVPRRFRRSAS